MKKTAFLIFCVFNICTFLYAQSSFWVFDKDGSFQEFSISEVDSISLVEPGYLELSPAEKLIGAEGGQFSIDITANRSWTVSSSDPVVIPETTHGTGNAVVSVVVLPSERDVPSTSVITITLENGLYKQLEVISRIGFLTDCQNNVYRTVKIGDQWWMAENLRCTKYDTESERAGEPLFRSSYLTDKPYYIDASDKSIWNSRYLVEFSDEQISKFGCLYNWAAVVGLEDEIAVMAQTSDFEDKRQGICPNGWHVPTKEEWNILATVLSETNDTQGGKSTIGKKMKTTSGWYSDGNGTDEYFFAVLPAGYAQGNSVGDVGGTAFFWTATPTSFLDGYHASLFYLFYSYDSLKSASSYKDRAQSVRCVKN